MTRNDGHEAEIGPLVVWFCGWCGAHMVAHMTRGELTDIIRESLTPLGLYSDRALRLLLGTCAVESSFGRWRVQLNGGPARGIYQMEPATFRWLRTKYGKRYPSVSEYSFADQQTDDHQATVMARLRYLAVPEPLPIAEDIHGQAAYWKRHYNTHLGAGTVEKYLRAYWIYVDGEQS